MVEMAFSGGAGAGAGAGVAARIKWHQQQSATFARDSRRRTERWCLAIVRLCPVAVCCCGVFVELQLKELRLRWHPDKNPVLQEFATEVTKIINEAIAASSGK